MATSNPDYNFFDGRLPWNRIFLLKQMLSQNSTSQNDCLIWTGPVTKTGYGIYKLTHRGRRWNLKVHRLAFYLHLEAPLPRDKHVSHICHTKTCIKICHLSLEPQSVNNSRLVCKNEGYCGGHIGYKKCLLGND